MNEGDLCAMTVRCLCKQTECVAHDVMAALYAGPPEDFDNYFRSYTVHIRLRHVRRWDECPAGHAHYSGSRIGLLQLRSVTVVRLLCYMVRTAPFRFER